MEELPSNTNEEAVMSNNAEGAKPLVLGGDRQAERVHSDENLLMRIQQVIDAHVTATGKRKARVLTYVIEELVKSKRGLDDRPVDDFIRTPRG